MIDLPQRWTAPSSGLITIHWLTQKDLMVHGLVQFAPKGDTLSLCSSKLRYLDELHNWKYGYVGKTGALLLEESGWRSDLQ